MKIKVGDEVYLDIEGLLCGYNYEVTDVTKFNGETILAIEGHFGHNDYEKRTVVASGLYKRTAELEEIRKELLAIESGQTKSRLISALWKFKVTT